MPTYVFKCVPNGHQFETQLGFADPAPTMCAVCGAEPVKKVFTPVGVTFRGSGFYKTDSRGGSSSSSPAKEGSASDSGSSTSSNTTSESKSSSSDSGASSSGSSAPKTDNSAPASTSGSKSPAAAPTSS